MSKVILIDSCSDCPFCGFDNSKQDYDSDCTVIYCKHINGKVVQKRSIKLKNIAIPPNQCPLSDIDDYKKD